MHIVFVTTKNRKEAEKIAGALLKEKLIACANIIDGVSSLFWWQGKIDRAREALLILKTRESVFKKLETRIKSLHSYKVPEIIAVHVASGSKEYLAWVKNSVVL